MIPDKTSDSLSRSSHMSADDLTRLPSVDLVPKYQLKLTKTYELAKVDGDPAMDVDAKAYHLVLTLQVTNLDSKPHEVAYRLDGPNGLPVEGAWYATKVQKTGLGLRDIVYKLNHSEFEMAACSELSEKSDKGEQIPQGHARARSLPTTISPCSSASMPNISRPPCCPIRVRPPRPSIVPWPLRVGEIEEQRRTLTNTSVPHHRQAGDDRARQVVRSAKLRAVCRPQAAHAAGRSTKCRAWSTTAGRSSIGWPCP